MASSIDASTSGAGGVITTADNTGILQLKTAGTTAVTVDASQNVGIGTTSPSVPLDVYSTGSVQGKFIRNNTGSASGGITVGNNSGTFTFYADTALQIYGGATERMRIDSSGNLLFNSGYGSVATAYGCRAWVNFNGTGTVAIRASGNVTSITDNGTGDYTINLTNAMPDTNYAVASMGVGETSTAGPDDTFFCINRVSGAQQTTSIRVGSRRPSASVDPPIYCVAVFR